MKVILTAKIKNLGNIGDVKVVADGYGKNYLLPKKLAIPYSEKNYKNFEEKKAIIEKENEELHSKALSNKEKIEKIEIVILENAGDNNKLYGSISSLRIANKINELINSKEISKSNVIIKNLIKELGKFTVLIELHNDVVFEKEIFVARSIEEVKKLKSQKKIEVKKEEQQEAEKTE